jgi:drug/metabolite transporter (DMT)-like permease
VDAPTTEAKINTEMDSQVIGQGIVTYTLKRFSSGFVSLFLLLEPLITTILAWGIFFERLSWLNGLAFFVVLAGIYLAKSGQGTEKVKAE